MVAAVYWLLTWSRSVLLSSVGLQLSTVFLPSVSRLIKNTTKCSSCLEHWPKWNMTSAELLTTHTHTHTHACTHTHTYAHTHTHTDTNTRVCIQTCEHSQAHIRRIHTQIHTKCITTCRQTRHTPLDRSTAVKLSIAVTPIRTGRQSYLRTIHLIYCQDILPVVLDDCNHPMKKIGLILQGAMHQPDSLWLNQCGWVVG